MSRLDPLPMGDDPELAEAFAFFPTTLGFVPNSVRIMQRRPKLVQALRAMNAAAMDPGGDVDLGFRRLIGHVASRAAGCRYCMAHTAHAAERLGVPEAKLTDLWSFETSPHYSPAERVALEFSAAAAQVPNAVTDELFSRLKQHWSEGEIVEILGVIALFGFLNRWNDTLGTPLEEPASEVGERLLAAQGWSPGKHAGDSD